MSVPSITIVLAFDGEAALGAEEAAGVLMLSESIAQTLAQHLGGLGCDCADGPCFAPESDLSVPACASARAYHTALLLASQLEELCDEHAGRGV